jgi:purine-binding chemotaxis protein CheW
MASTLLEKPAVAAADSAERQVVALHLGQEIYGVDISLIHSVLTPQPITTVPNVPSFVLGVMNLRGRILPVLDLRTRFGMPPLDDEKKRLSRIVIVEAAGLTAGLVVDAVSEVLTLSVGSIEPPSALLGSSDLRCLTGIGRVGNKSNKENEKKEEGRLILLLDIVETLTSVAALTSHVDVE